MLLAECCDCLAHTIVHLPEFSERAAAESLSRLSSAVGSLEMILARLPVRTLDAPGGYSLDGEFTRRYLASVIANLDRLELFGVRMERLTRPRATLSVAYISLNVTEELQVTDEMLDRLRESGRKPVSIAEWREERRAVGTVRVERALGEHRLMLIRGEAGGGKSTLLRWLAVSAARGTFTGELAPLNGHVPFLVKLRSHADQGLPHTEELLDDVAAELSSIMPDKAWAHRQLQSGRALLLVDGIDEIIETQRQHVREWLGRFTSLYPEVRIVVTSRPAAAEADWLRAEGFRSAFLEPLNPADLTELIRHWHVAIRDSGDLPFPAERLPAYEARLMARLESAPYLRTLAGTPLLAAMLCALNLDRNSLPRDRMGLYAAAIEMLLEKRDTLRGIPSAQNIPLERDQKLGILRELAWHLSTTDRVELPKSLAQGLVDKQIDAMPRVQDRVSGEEALDTLLQRSGIIREPVRGRIEFVHRTVQEYLTAAHCADIGDMELLIGSAHLDRWRETIIMAAGHANRPQQTELIQGIISRAEREPAIRRKLRLLAAGCLETVPAVAEDLRTSLNRCLDQVIPPRDTSEAALLAAIGEAILRRLPENLEGLSPQKAQATVRTAWLVNGPDSLDVLRRYATDARLSVQGELMDAWSYYDLEEYAERVLTAMGPGGYAEVTSLAQLEALTMAPLSRLVIRVPGLTSIEVLESLPPLSGIEISNCNGVEDYSPLRRSLTLDTLILNRASRLQKLEQLPSLKKVTDLALTGSCLPLGSLTALIREAPMIHRLHLDNCAWVNDVAPLAGLPSLEQLSIKRIRPGTDLSPLARCKNVRVVYVASGQDVRGGDMLGNRLFIK